MVLIIFTSQWRTFPYNVEPLLEVDKKKLMIYHDDTS